MLQTLDSYGRFLCCGGFPFSVKLFKNDQDVVKIQTKCQTKCIIRIFISETDPFAMYIILAQKQLKSCSANIRCNKKFLKKKTSLCNSFQMCCANPCERHRKPMTFFFSLFFFFLNNKSHTTHAVPLCSIGRVGYQNVIAKVLSDLDMSVILSPQKQKT